MKYEKLGNTGIEVSKLCVGCMNFGKAGTMHDWTSDEERSGTVIRHALELGIIFLTRQTPTLPEPARSIWGAH